MGTVLTRLLGRPLAGKWMNALAEKAAALSGRFLYKPHVAWWGDRSWTSPYAKYLTETRILDRRFTLVRWAESVRSLRGSTAECGVYTGAGSALVCKALDGSYDLGECHFGFDSFEGLSQPVTADRHPGEEAAASYALRAIFRRQWRKGDLSSPLEVAQGRVADFPFCRLVKGWIPDSLAAAAGEVFRFVHVDVDLYQPTWDSLAFFYPRTTSGGVILFDDYGFLSCPGARSAILHFFADKPEPVVELATGQAVVIKR